MKVHTINGVNYHLPNEPTPFQLEMYVHLIDWKWRHITTAPGTYRDESYDAILPDEYTTTSSWPHLYPKAVDSLSQHLKKNPFRIHKHFYHMASSQAANANLFLPILHHPKVNAILGALKPDFASLAASRLDNGYCIEFWGGNFGGSGTGIGNTGFLGDKSANAGTDSDIAIAYHNHRGELCLWLIEHKLTEKEFTECGGFKSGGRQAQHDCSKCFSDILRDKTACYYHDRKDFNYWKLTEGNQKFFVNHASHAECPFQGGMNQLWRNQLLGLAIEQDADQPYEHVTFSVVKHPRNTDLDETLTAYKHLIADDPKFTVFTSADVIAAAEANGDSVLDQWITWYKELYKL